MNCRFELVYRVSGRLCRYAGGGTDDLSLTVSDDGSRRTVTVCANAPLELREYRETEHDFFTRPELSDPDPKGDLYFINGYQSWTETREFYGDARERDVKLLPKPLLRSYALDRYGDALFYEYDKRILHGYDAFYVKGTNEAFVWSLNSKNAYLIAEVVRRVGAVTLRSDLRGVRLQAGETYTVCDYLYAGDLAEGLRLTDRFFPKKPCKKIFGYTSWYNYYQDISEQILLRDLDALDGRFNLFQIDDGYETFVGDWPDVNATKFPHGLAPIAEKIHEKGYLAGIWLAPFVAEKKSRLFREKSDWLRKGADGQPVKCGSNWSGFYALDLDNPAVRGYIRDCLTHYADMGFDFFKLDFLYAANLPDYDGKTRSRVAEEAYAFLREALGDKLILGCGATAFNAAGKFDYLRVGPDVSLSFDDAWYMRRLHRERVSTKVTLQNTIYRSLFDGRLFGNDPDVFLLRDGNISLSGAQRQALITIDALFGSVMMTSDNIAEYDEEKRTQLSRALELFRNAAVTGFHRRGDTVTVSYTLHGENAQLRYDTEKGVLI